MDVFPVELQEAAKLEQNRNRSNQELDEMNPFQRWIYTMRREMQEILPNVWLGPYASAMKKNEEQLNQVGITHIISVRTPKETFYIRQHFPERITYLILDISDKPTQNIIQHFRKACEFINNALSNNGRVLIHGLSGISRSASLVIAYVMTQKVCSFDDAYKYVQQRRFCIHPSESFKRQLIEFEPIFMAQMIHQNPVGGFNGYLKRPLEEDY